MAAEDYWRLPERWDRAAAKAGVRRRVFLGSMMDFFEDWAGPLKSPCGAQYATNGNQWVPGLGGGGGFRLLTLEEVRRRVCAIIDRTPHLNWLIVTKRPENIRRMWPPAVGCRDDLGGDGQTVSDYRPNVWLLASCEDQSAADARIPHLLACRDLVPVLGLSCEPLLGPVDLTGCVEPPCRGDVRSGHLCQVCHSWRPRIDWVIAGGESGPQARPMHPAWVRGLRDQCQAAGVPFFFKQWGEWAPSFTSALYSDGTEEGGECGGPAAIEYNTRPPTVWLADGSHRRCPVIAPGDHHWGRTGQLTQTYCRVGKAAAGRTLDGRTWDETPMLQGVETGVIEAKIVRSGGCQIPLFRSAR